MTISRKCLSVLVIIFMLMPALLKAQVKMQYKKIWVDSVYNKLTEEERIGQLFMVAAYSGGKNYNEDKITQLLTNHQIGGLIFMQGGAGRQANLTNKYQDMAQVPLLIGMDAEWGLGMRLDSIKNFPRQMMLGATRDTSLVREMATAIAYQCKRLGVHIDFAPDIDVNNNPQNPVINFRSFGEDKTRVAAMGIAYMHALQQNGVMACAKHFPGHGDTNVDSHQDLPVVNKSLAQLDTLELYPFRQLIKAGVQSIMVAHVDVPALDTGAHVPTTLSRNTVTGLLREHMGFKGLIFTDALNMKGVTKYYEQGEVDLKAFLAGNDVLLFSQDVPTAIAKIKAALDSGLVTQADLEFRVKKILAAKYDAGLATRKYINPINATDDLNRYTDVLKEKIAKAAVTVIRDENGIINKVNRNMHVAYVGINADTTTLLYEQLKDSLRIIVPAFWVSRTKAIDTGFASKLSYYDAVIVALHNTNFYPGATGNYGLTDEQVNLVKQLQTLGNTMVTVMGNAYIMQNFCEARSALVAYEDDSVTEHVVANLFLRKFRPRGKLPVTACKYMPLVAATTAPVLKTPVPLTKTIFPTDAGVVNTEALYKLNLFLQRCIQDQAFPGCRVVASKNGIVFYDKSFGYYTYSRIKPVDTNTIYDLASLTKVVATDLAVMHLYDIGQLRLDKTLGDYLPWTKGTNKADLQIKDILLHQAGLKSWMPFYKETLDAAGNLRFGLYSTVATRDYSIHVAQNLYLRNDYVDTIWHEILASPLENLGKYVYSDLDYYFLAAIVHHLTGKTVDKYVDEQFYKPMGLQHIGYLPLTRFDSSNIAPTENDIVFRHSQLQGYVHDQGAALFGGVQGHAGVFATADDVAAIFQMFLNKGTYKGKRFIKASTIEYFSQYNSHISRRGIGFDKPNADAEDGGPAGDRTTGYAFGHQGYTGTCAWVDPATGVVFVFLSNRLYPGSDGKSSNKINQLNVRTVSQDYIYEALGIPVNHDRPEVYKEETSKR